MTQRKYQNIFCSAVFSANLSGRFSTEWRNSWHVGPITQTPLDRSHASLCESNLENRLANCGANCKYPISVGRHRAGNYQNARQELNPKPWDSNCRRRARRPPKAQPHEQRSEKHLPTGKCCRPASFPLLYIALFPTVRSLLRYGITHCYPLPSAQYHR